MKKVERAKWSQIEQILEKIARKGPDERILLYMAYGSRGPRGMCACGHPGDGVRSAHHNGPGPGHGPCTCPGCPCDKFVWEEDTPEYKDYLRRRAN